MDTKNYEPKYRAFRWALDIPGITPWTCASVVARTKDRNIYWDVRFYYNDGMEPGVCPVTSGYPQKGTLNLLDTDGQVMRTCVISFALIDYIPITNLDYNSSMHVTGQVTLGIIEERWS